MAISLNSDHERSLTLANITVMAAIVLLFGVMIALAACCSYYCFIHAWLPFWADPGILEHIPVSP